ncbi:hypothetical protein pipiens_009134 [Culex pipiens pipiens]|uniref:Ionotropic glutamate receptor L-glutamate and glycine-binding domain-containing protein n=1 Tax=Culex pipiens pipiens TaxID=38569 RepID=A0ABD1DEW9_CULPP
MEVVKICLVFAWAIAIASAALNHTLFEDENDLADYGRLIVDLVGKTKPGHCYAFVTDPIYRVTLTDTLFKEIGGHPRFVVEIPEDEDTLRPGKQVRCMLEEIRKIGCGAYVVLIANGIQMERFLSHKRSHFELSTVPFPLPLKGVFVSKRLDFWHNGKFRYGRKLFSDKTASLDGQTMRVVVLEHTPAIFRTTLNETSSENRQRIKYSGLEVELLKAVAQAMRFEMNLYETEDAGTEKWGTIMEDDNSTGLLGDMNEGRADFALADLHYTLYHLAIMDLSIPYNTECLTFLTPEALTDNSWTTLILPFTGGMWAGVLVSLFSIGTVFYALSRLMMYIRHEKIYRRDLELVAKRRKVKSAKRVRTRINHVLKRKPVEKDTLDLSKLKMLKMVPFKRQALPWRDPLPPRDIFDTFSGCIIYTYSMLLLVSLPRLPKGWPLRLLTGWYWIYCILLVVAYRASLTAILSKPVARLTIDKLKDLAESPIRCGAWGEQNRLFFQTAQDKPSMIIGEKLEHTPDPDAAVERVVRGNFAYYDNVYSLKHLRSTRKSEKARQNLHIMEECAVHMPISIGLEKNSPLKPKVDKYVRALVETGLTKKWLADAIEAFQSNVELPPQEATMDLQKLTAAFIGLALGYGISLLAFGVEKLYWRCVIERDPAYDKYLTGTCHRRVIRR